MNVTEIQNTQTLIGAIALASLSFLAGGGFKYFDRFLKFKEKAREDKDEPWKEMFAQTQKRIDDMGTEIVELRTTVNLQQRYIMTLEAVLVARGLETIIDEVQANMSKIDKNLDTIIKKSKSTKKRL